MQRLKVTRLKTASMKQCEKCGIPKYRHNYFEDCGHDFVRIAETTGVKE